MRMHMRLYYAKEATHSHPFSSIQLNKSERIICGEWIWIWSLVVCQRKTSTKFYLQLKWWPAAIETQQCVCCFFEMDSWLVGSVFLFEKRFDDFDNIFCRSVCLLCRSPIFCSSRRRRRRFLLLSSSVSVFGRFLCLYFCMKKLADNLWIIDFFFTMNETCKFVCVWCLDDWNDWHEKNNFFFEWRKIVNTYISFIYIFFRLCIYLVSWEYLILLYC